MASMVKVTAHKLASRSTFTLRADGSGFGSAWRVWELTLACGHTAVRPVSGPTPPGRLKCKACEAPSLYKTA